jgi:microsomal dipeptidase-like Zn-dependent dipeptidase
MDDEQLLALRKTGGVIQCVALAAFVKTSPERDAALAELRQQVGLPRDFGSARDAVPDFEAKLAAYRARAPEVDRRFPRATVADFVDHIDHAVDLIGIDHVAISSDFDGGGGVDGWNDASETFNVTLELVRRGYTEEEIAKIWSGNTLRLWRDVERVAAELRAAGK